MLFVSPPAAERFVPPGSALQPAGQPEEGELAVEWTDVSEPAADTAVWRSGYRISNRGGAPTGPLQLRVRTPLGLLAQSQLTAGLAVGETFAGTVEVQVVPGLSELCLDVRAVAGERTRREADSSNHRVCRRLSRPASVRPLHAVARRPEDAP